MARRGYMNPEEFGWRSNGKYHPVQGHTEPCPKEIAAQLCCSCKKDCSSQQCSCQKSGIKCTNSCRCSDQCKNIISNFGPSSSEEIESEDEHNWLNNFTCLCVVEPCNNSIYFDLIMKIWVENCFLKILDFCLFQGFKCTKMDKFCHIRVFRPRKPHIWCENCQKICFDFFQNVSFFRL